MAGAAVTVQDAPPHRRVDAAGAVALPASKARRRRLRGVPPLHGEAGGHAPEAPAQVRALVCSAMYLASNSRPARRALACAANSCQVTSARPAASTTGRRRAWPRTPRRPRRARGTGRSRRRATAGTRRTPGRGGRGGRRSPRRSPPTRPRAGGRRRCCRGLRGCSPTRRRA
jgi:hypothetical protein